MKIKIILILLFLNFSCKEQDSSLRFSCWQSSPTEERIINQSLDSFKAKFPEVKYRFQPIPGNYTEKIQLMLGTGKSPDLFWLKGDTSPAYMSFDVLKPLDSFVKASPYFDIDDFFPVFKDAFKFKGKYYGFGKDFNAYVLFYNPKMLEEAGLKTPPTNWEELEHYSKLLTKDKDGDGIIDQYGFIVEPSIDMVLPFAFQNGGEIISDNNKIKIGDEEFIQSVEFFVNLYRNGVATIPADLGAGWNGDAYGRQQVAMAISGAWMIPYLKESYPNVPFKVAEENGFYQDSILNTFFKSVEYAKLYKINMQERWYDETQATMQAIFYKNKPPRGVLPKLAKNLERFKLIKDEIQQ